jgi:hypothetical protein
MNSEMRIYVTHCSAKKDISLIGTSLKVTPNNLYTATPTQRFMNKCKDSGVNWTIFSDELGIWFPDIKYGWYEKDPSKVTNEEFDKLVTDFDAKLSAYDEIWFYYNPGRFHPLYKKLLRKSNLKDKIKKFTHLSEIVPS